MSEKCLAGEPLPASIVQRVASRTSWNSVVLLDAMVPREDKAQVRSEGEGGEELLELQKQLMQWIEQDVIAGKKAECSELRQAFLAAATAKDAGEAVPPMLLDEPSQACLSGPLREATSSYRYITALTDGLESVAVLTVINGAYTVRRIEGSEFSMFAPAKTSTRKRASAAPEVPSRPFVVVPVPRGAVVALLGDAKGLPQPDVWQGVVDTDVLVWVSRPERRCVYLDARTSPDQTVLLDGRPVETGTVLVAPGPHWLVAGACGEASCQPPQYYKVPASDIDIAPGANCVELSIDFRPAKNVTVLTPSIGRTCPAIWASDVEGAATSVLETRFELEHHAMNDIADFSAALKRLGQSLDEGDAHDQGPARASKGPASLSKLSTTLWREGLSEVYQLEVVCQAGGTRYRVVGRRWELSKVRDEAGDARFIRNFPLRATQEFTNASDLQAAVRSVIHQLRREPFVEILYSPEQYQRTSVRPLAVRVLVRGVARDQVSGTLWPAEKGPKGCQPRGEAKRLGRLFERNRSFPFVITSRSQAADASEPATYVLRGNPVPGLYVASFALTEGTSQEKCIEIYAGQIELGVELRAGRAVRSKDTISNVDANVELLGTWSKDIGSSLFMQGLMGWSYARAQLRTPTALPPVGSDLSRYDPLGRSASLARRHGFIVGGRFGSRLGALNVRNMVASAALEGALRVQPGSRYPAGRTGLNFGYDFPLNSLRLSLYFFLHGLFGPYTVPYHNVSFTGGASLGVSWSVNVKYRRRRN